MNLTLSLTTRLLSICTVCIVICMTLLVLFGFEMGRRSVVQETASKPEAAMVATNAHDKPAAESGSKP